MQFDLNETQKILKKGAQDFFKAECPMHDVRRIAAQPDAFDAALWKMIAEQGWTGICFDEEFGGAGMGPVEAAVLLEEMGYALLPGPFFSTVLLAGNALAAAGTKAQQAAYLAPIAAGEKKATLAFLENGASWNPDLVKLKAAPGADGICELKGTKLFVTDAGVADFLVVAAKGREGLVLAVADARQKGVKIRPMPALDLTRPYYEVTFRGAAAEVLTTGAEARRALDRTLDLAAAALCAEMTGGMQRVLELTVGYAKTRKQFNVPIGQFQAVQHQCADMLLYTESSRSAALYAAYALAESTADAALAVSVAKSYASDAYREVGNRGIQIHGGMGFTWENDVHFYYRRAKASETMFGDAAFHRDRIARLLAARTAAAAAVAPALQEVSA
jgi:alkylation response protein AidB-like acyl-CoA dehydrogenase